VGTALVLLLLAGCGGGGSNESGSAYKEPAGPATETVDIAAGNFYFKPSDVSAAPGIANLEVKSEGGLHTLVFERKYPGFQLEVSGSGDTDSLKIDLKPGTYTFYCDIDSHRQQGMHGTLTVK
jgi:plastocyanin